jgi:hypothetical protein
MSEAGGKVPFPRLLAVEDFDAMREIQSRLASALEGTPLGFALPAIAAEVALIEGNHDLQAGEFEAWLEAWRSRIPEAKKMAAISRQKN